MKTLSHFREEYSMGVLEESALPDDPLLLFDQWLEDAITNGLPEPNAMTLATVTPKGQAAARVLLLKEVRDGRFIFYTNYNSQKGEDLKANPNASLVFLWLQLQRQVRVSGSVRRIPERESDAYFAARPRNSQIGAVISAQSKPIKDRKELEEAFYKLFDETREQEIQRPKHWGGYQLIPDAIEFWQGRESRLHDRIHYSRKEDKWVCERLAP